MREILIALFALIALAGLIGGAAYFRRRGLKTFRFDLRRFDADATLGNEKIMSPRIFVADSRLSSAWIDRIAATATKLQIPDGYTEAKLLANELKTDYEAHRVVTPAVHNSADTTNVISAAAATTIATLVLLANDLKAKYNAHCADATAHNSADTTNVVATADADSTDDDGGLKGAVTLLNAIRTAYEAHRVNVVAHDGADATNVIAMLTAVSWTQRYAGDDGAEIIHSREIANTRNILFGNTRYYIKDQGLKFKIPISEFAFRDLIRLLQLDPSADADVDTGGFYKRNSGIEMAGFTVMIYDHQTDPDNESDVPDPTGDTNGQLIYNAMVTAEPVIRFTGEQNILSLEGDGISGYLAGSGDGKGHRGCFGTFKAVTA